MKQYIYALIALLFMLIAGLPASAQWRTGAEALQAIRQGTTDFILPSTVKEIIEPTVFAAESAILRSVLQANVASVANAQANLTSPIDLAATSAQVRATIGASPTFAYVDVAVQRQTTLSEAQQSLQQTLYRWGELQDRAQQLGYVKDTYAVAMPDGSARLKINGKSVRVALTQQFADPFPLIFPDDIYNNAAAIKNLADSYTRMESRLLAERPEHAAAWFYLKENFLNSWEKFQAARSAYLQLYPPTHGGVSNIHNWMINIHHESNPRIRRNYNCAAAELGLNGAKLLKYVSMHENIFPQAIASYERMLNPGSVNNVFRSILPQNPFLAH